jgi:phosphate transport system permease protein
MSRPSQPGPDVSHPLRKKGRSTDGFFKYFFASNAGLTILILVLIIVFLVREGAGFFPAYRKSLEIYRRAGLEFVDINRADLTAHEQLMSLLNRAYFAELNSHCVAESTRADEAAALVGKFNDITAPARDALSHLAESTEAVSAAEKDSKRDEYQGLAASAMTSLPAAPHITVAERSAILAELKSRDAVSNDDPPTAAAIARQLQERRAKEAAPLSVFHASIDRFEAAGSALAGLVGDMSETAKATKEAADSADERARGRGALLEAAAKEKDTESRKRLETEAAAEADETVNFHERTAALLAKADDCLKANAELAAGAKDALAGLPATLHDAEAMRCLKAAKAAWPSFTRGIEDTPSRIKSWNPDKPVGIAKAVGGFLLGRDWITGGDWQDMFGVVPLFVGSALIALIALLLAIPLGVGAAVYTNQFASPREQKIIKPVIEFIQAIPSVVLGFVGIVVVGTALRDMSVAKSLDWVPGFPVQERLNMFTAGCLLALMAIPTIFSLAEDALNNVPQGFAEASDALGASRIQTVFRVMIPAAVSGILAAVLLGLGRVIGETMVVLLVAGNRIKIPDFTQGLGVIFQPSHTLTGIIAQELGEVPYGSIHYRALFVVGLLLFLIVLAINWSAQRLLKRFRIAQH